MKKLINLKEIMIILVSVVLITVSTSVFATDLVLGDNNSQTQQITGNEYDNAQQPTIDNNTVGNNTTNNSVNNTTNKAKTYNTSENDEDLPQTGIEDYNVGILLVICIASAIFAYKKINDYKNI